MNAKQYLKDAYGDFSWKNYPPSESQVADWMEEYAEYQWIAVEDRLPLKTTGETSDKVLVYKTDIKGNEGISIMRYNHTQGFWTSKTGTCNVTHWKDLPERPNIKKTIDENLKDLQDMANFKGFGK